MHDFVARWTLRARQSISMVSKNKTRKFLSIFFLSVFIFGMFAVAVHPAYGQETITNGLIRAVSWIMLSVAQVCIALAIFFLRFFITLASYNNYIDVGIVKIGWAMVRDVANMFFVVALLVIAFATILGLEQYEWKKGLVKLILMAIFINFSNLIAQVVIDVAHVFTITFLNAISATAGGNLISMFSLDQITSFIYSKEGVGWTTPEDVELAVLGGAVVATFFAIFAALGIGSYAIVMAIRVTVLWALIILSPLAYIAAALPKAEKYAQEWWGQFSKHVLVAPVMVFFLWLAFSTLGSGNIIQQIQKDNSVIELHQTGESPSASLSSISTWENMANYIIGLIFLVIGLKATQQTGAYGSGMVSGVMNFGKRVATIASGYAVGRWLVGGVAKGVGKGISSGTKGLLWHMPVVGGEKWSLRAQNEWQAVKKWYRNKAAGISPEVIKKQRDLALEQQKLGLTEASDRRVVRENIKGLEEKRAQAQSPEERAELDQEINKNKGLLGELDTDKRKQVQENVQKLQGELEQATEKASSGILAKASQSSLRLEKQLAKTTKESESVRELAWKRTGSEAGGIFFQRRAKMFSDGKEEITVDAQDRIIRGMLAAEELRSGAKDEEFETLGKFMVLGHPRFKNGAWLTPKPGEEKKSMTDMIAGHKIAGSHFETAIKDLEEEARLHIVVGFKKGMNISKLQGELDKLKLNLGSGKGIDGKLLSTAETQELKVQIEKKEKELSGLGADTYKEWKSASGVTYNQFVERQAMAHVVEETLKAYEERFSQDRLGEIFHKGLRVDELGGKWETGQFEDAQTQEKIKKLTEKREALAKEHADIEIKTINLNSEIKDLEDDRSAAEKGQLKEVIDQRIDVFTNRKKGIEGALEEINKQIADRDLKIEAAGSDETKKKQLKNEKNSLVSNKEQAERNLERVNEQLADNHARQEEFKDQNRDAILATIATQESERKALLAVAEAEAKNKKDEKIAKETEIELSAGSLRREADIIRGGGKAAEQLLETKATALQGMLATATDADKLEIQKKISTIRGTLSDMKTGGRFAWEFGVAKGEQADVAKHHQYYQNELLSISEQRTIWDKRGVYTPSSALSELIEQAEKNFREMGYDQYVSSVGDLFKTFLHKRKMGEEITASDKASIMGLFRRGFQESWIDDAVIGIMKNSDTRGEIGSAIGWKDNSFSPDKIGDVINLFQTAGDVDYTKKNVVMREFIDLAATDDTLGMSVEEMIANVKGGKFSAEKQGELRSKIKSHLNSIGRDFTKEQEKFFESMITGTDDGKKFVDQYLQVARDNQASFQYMGNLRNEAIQNGHPENSGWSLYKDVGGGERIYISSGARMARGHAYSDFNKLETRQRVKAHPHVEFDLDGDTQVAIRVREDDFGVKFKGVDDPRAMGSVTSRDINVITCIGGTENPVDFRRKDGSYDFTMSKDAVKVAKEKFDYEYRKLRKKSSYTEEHLQAVIGEKVKEARDKGEQLDEKQLKEIEDNFLQDFDRAFTAQMAVKHKLLGSMRAKMNVVLMSLATQSTGVSQQDAAFQGKMNITLPVLSRGKVKNIRFNNVKDLLDEIENGSFGDYEGAVPSFSAPTLSEEQMAERVRESMEDDIAP